jgi:hypothetical protein
VPFGQKCGEMSFSVSWAFRVPPLGQSLDPADHELSGPLHQAGVSDRERRGDPPSPPHGRHGQDEEREPAPGVVLHAEEHMIRVLP